MQNTTIIEPVILTGFYTSWKIKNYISLQKIWKTVTLKVLLIVLIGKKIILIFTTGWRIYKEKEKTQLSIINSLKINESSFFKKPFNVVQFAIY